MLGDRRKQPRIPSAHADAKNHQRRIAEKLAKVIKTTPEQLLIEAYRKVVLP